MKLVTLETIDEVKNHPNADLLDLVRVSNYQCVVKRDEFKMGDQCIFIRPDTVLPDKEWASSFKKFSPNRVKTQKIRGELSTGIVLKVESDVHEDKHLYRIKGTSDWVALQKEELDADLSSFFGVRKHESDIPKGLEVKSMYLPHGLSKTDEDNWQNLKKYNKIPFGETVNVTLKIDGTSATVYCKLQRDNSGNIISLDSGITSRKHVLKTEKSNVYTDVIIKKHDLMNKLIRFCVLNNCSLAIRGEIYGNGIQSSKHNKHSQMKNGFYCFSVFDLDQLKYVSFDSQFGAKRVSKEFDIEHVPVIEENVTLTQELIDKYDVGIKNINGYMFEGVVVQGKTFSFKVINKHYDELK